MQQNDHDTKPNGLQYLTMRKLRAKLGGRSKAGIYADVAAGRLPKPLKLGTMLFWVESEVDERMLAMRVDDSDAESCTPFVQPYEKKKPGKRRKYPWLELDVGDSFTVEGKDCDAMSLQAYNASKRYGMKFSVRATTGTGQTGCEVTRTA